MTKRWWAGLFVATWLMLLACSGETDKQDPDPNPGTTACRDADGWLVECK